MIALPGSFYLNGCNYILALHWFYLTKVSLIVSACSKCSASIFYTILSKRIGVTVLPHPVNETLVRQKYGIQAVLVGNYSLTRPNRHLVCNQNMTMPYI